MVLWGGERGVRGCCWPPFGLSLTDLEAPGAAQLGGARLGCAEVRRMAAAQDALHTCIAAREGRHAGLTRRHHVLTINPAQRPQERRGPLAPTSGSTTGQAAPLPGCSPPGGPRPSPPAPAAPCRPCDLGEQSVIQRPSLIACNCASASLTAQAPCRHRPPPPERQQIIKEDRRSDRRPGTGY